MMKQWAKKIMTLARKKIKLNNEEQPIENINKNHQSFQGKIHEEKYICQYQYRIQCIFVLTIFPLKVH